MVKRTKNIGEPAKAEGKKGSSVNEATPQHGDKSSSQASAPSPHEGGVGQALSSLDYQISVFEKLKRKNPSQKKLFKGYIKTAKAFKSQILREQRLTSHIAKEVNQGNEFIAAVKLSQLLGAAMVLTDGTSFVA